MRISDWSSDVCSSDLVRADSICAPEAGHRAARHARLGEGDGAGEAPGRALRQGASGGAWLAAVPARLGHRLLHRGLCRLLRHGKVVRSVSRPFALSGHARRPAGRGRSEEHTSELQSLMRISYAVFCLKKKKKPKITNK